MITTNGGNESAQAVIGEIRQERSENGDVWDFWPTPEKVIIPLLSEHACYDRSQGFTKEDGRWKRQVIRLVEQEKINIARCGEERQHIRQAIEDLSLRCHHASRMMEASFGSSSQNHHQNHYQNPLLETIIQQLRGWKSESKVDCLFNKLLTSFDGPRSIAYGETKTAFIDIFGTSRKYRKKPDMLVELVRAFIKQFPDGDILSMRAWKDDAVLDFLTQIPGIDRCSALCVLTYSLGRPRFPVDVTVTRVLERTQLLKEFIVEEDNSTPSTIQAIAESAIPPSLRAALHNGLSSVGIKYCLTNRSACTKCPLISICNYHAVVARKDVNRAKFNHVDLFCGAGGFSAGFSKEGFKTILAVDFEPAACDTFKLNHPEIPPENVQCEDLSRRRVKTIIDNCSAWKDQLRPGGVDVLTAGIPCQGFSKAGYRSRPGIKYDPLNDPRNHLYKNVINWVRNLQPRYAVLENVPEIRSAGGENHRILDALCNALKKNGYRVDYGIVNANDVGVPQTRYRMIIMASHPSVPEVKVSELKLIRKVGPNLNYAIGDLPELNAGCGKWYIRKDGSVLTGHVARYNNSEDLKIFDALDPGEHYKTFIQRHKGKEIIDERKRNGKYAVYDTKSFSDKYYRLKPDAPSRTIVAHLNKDGNGYIHPYQVRSITPREAMRIQGFDDRYMICGSASKQYVQIGNAVPPPLARNIAKLLAMRLAGKS